MLYDDPRVPSTYNRLVDVFAIGRMSIEMTMEDDKFHDEVKLGRAYSTDFHHLVLETAKESRIRKYASELLRLPFLTSQRKQEGDCWRRIVELARHLAKMREQRHARSGGASTVTAVGEAHPGGGATTTTAVLGGVALGGGSAVISAVGRREDQPATLAEVTPAPADKKKSAPATEAPKRSLSPSSTRSGLPFCECAGCPMPPSPPSLPPPRVMLNQWIDVRVGDSWPKHPLVKALDKSLNTIDGQDPDQYVALWYQHGEPVMGRVWNERGEIAAIFAWNNREYMGKVGLIQLLVHTCEHVRGFDYHWKPFSEVFVFGTEREFVPVHVNHIAPAVISFNGKQILGKCDLRNEKASAGFGGKENVVNGPPVHPVTVVLTRKARAGCKFDERGSSAHPSTPFL